MEVEARRRGICGAVHDNRHDRRRRWRRYLRYAIGTVRSAGIVRVSSCGVVNAGGPWRRDRRSEAWRGSLGFWRLRPW